MNSSSMKYFKVRVDGDKKELTYDEALSWLKESYREIECTYDEMLHLEAEYPVSPVSFILCVKEGVES